MHPPVLVLVSETLMLNAQTGKLYILLVKFSLENFLANSEIYSDM